MAKAKCTKKKKAPRKSAYLREVQIRFRKKRIKDGSPVEKPIGDSRQIYELFQDLQNETKEKLITISLDIKLKIICFEVVAIGSLTSIYTRPFEAIRAALPLNPYGIILVHNHPSGDPSPNKVDKNFTKKLMTLTKAGGLYFLDHIIIGDEDYFSFADKELI